MAGPYHQDMSKWRRPYRGVIQFPGLWFWIIVPFALLAWWTWHGRPLTRADVVLLVAWELAIWRMQQVGVFVSPVGVRVGELFRTKVYRWEDIHRAWSSWGPNGALSLWLNVGRPPIDVATPVWTRSDRSGLRSRGYVSPEELDRMIALVTAKVEKRGVTE